MKELLKSFSSFTRKERMGLIGLSGLLIILLLARMTMHFWVKPDHNEQKEQEMVARWEAFKKEHTKAADTLSGGRTDSPDHEK